jgi:spore coat protein U-like protein
MKSFLTILILAACALNAQAGVATANMTSSAVLNKTCTLSTTNVEFGDYSALNVDHQLSSNTVTLKCSKGTAWNYYQYSAYYSIAGYADTVAAMVNGTSKLYYQAQVADGTWDNDIDRPASANLGHYLGTGNGLDQTFNVNYRLLKNQYVKPGSYVDNVTAYLVF